MDITKFCATNDPRHYLHKPMRHDGFLYATNGHVAVRIADDPAIEGGPMPQHLQNGILQKMVDDTEDRAWQPVPVIDKASLRDCAYCNGTGRATTCPVCDGEGEFEHFGDWYDCRRCETTGQVAAKSANDAATCSYCSGSGQDASQSVEVGGAHIAARYLHLIATEIPGAEIGISKNPLGVQIIRAPGVVGCVMPMRPHDTKEQA